MSTTSTTAAKAENSIGQVQFLTITALFIALTYVFTAFVNVRLPITANGGLIHLGNVPLFICAILFGKKSGALAGALAWDFLICSPAGLHGTFHFCDCSHHGLCSRRNYRKASRSWL